MLTITNKNGKIQKQVFITARYEVTKGEHAGRIIHMVRSVKQVKGQTVQHDYQVITFNDQDGRVTCDCPASGDCCHKDETSFNEMRQCNTIASVKAHLLATVNRELARVQAPAATQEEIADTQAHLLLPNDPDQIAYFVQTKRRAEAIEPVPTPMVRNVSQDWLLKGSRGGQFSGRVA